MKIVIIGGGPAGMMSAISAKEKNPKNEVIILEKNNQLGKKLLITGKGRCNITSSLDMEDFIKNIPGNGRFLYSAFNEFTNKDIINFLKEEGLEVKKERGDRIFPVTDKSLDVLRCFERRIKKLEIEVKYNVKVEKILVKSENKIPKEEKGMLLDKEGKTINEDKKTTDEDKISIDEKEISLKQDKMSIYGVKTNIGIIKADKVILATGGKSYPLTGSTGDGYNLAKELGHKITEIKPSLVPLEIYEKDICSNLQGLSLKNVSINIIDKNKGKVIYNDFGEMIFTHFGVSGPIILSASAHLVRYKNITQLLKENKIILKIDFKPALDEQKLDARILRDFEEIKNKQFKNSLDKLLPQKLIPVIIKKTNIDEEKRVNLIKKEERKKLVSLIKDFEVTISKFRPIEEAIITAGGISIKDINPKTMESKLVKNLFFAGEIIDVDAYTGGFNLQIAYSTGYVAGI